jgi:hypothetical protein
MFTEWKRVAVTKKNGTQAFISVLDDGGIGAAPGPPARRQQQSNW